MSGIDPRGALALGAMIALWVAPALAEGDAARAQSLFDAAVAQMEAGQWDDACAKLAESDRLEASGGTALNLGYCLEHQNHLGRAYEAYLLAADHYEASHKPDRRKVARERADALRGRVTVVRLEGERTGVTALLLDGDARTLADAAFAVDRGPHELVVKRDGGDVKLPFVAESPDLALELPKIAPPPPPPPVLEPPPPPLLRAPPPPLAPQRTPAWIAFGTAAGLAVVGSFTGAFALEREGASDAACPGGRCSADGVSAHDTARSLAIATDVLLATAIVGAGVGLVLWFTARTPRTAGAAPFVIRF